MNKRYSSRLSMNNTLLTLFEKYIEIVKLIPAFYLLYLMLKANVAAISSTEQSRSTKREGGITDKNVLRSLLEKQALVISSLMAAFAAATKNNELLKKISFSREQLRRQDDEALVITCGIISSAAGEYEEGLIPYAVTTDMIKAFDKQTDEFKKESKEPELSKKERKRQGGSLVTLFSENRSLLRDQMDKVAVGFADTHPEFYADYLNCRQIKDSRTNHTRAKGNITNKATGKVLRGVTVTAEGTTFSAVTNRNGNFKLLIPTPGIYTLVFTIEGYGTVTITNVEIKLGQSTSVDIEMATV